MITFGSPPAFRFDDETSLLNIKIAKPSNLEPVINDIVAQLQHVKQANIALSGGIDSQFSLRVAKHLNVPVTAYTYLALWDGAPVNTDDVQVATQIAKKENVELEIIEFDLKEFFNSKFLVNGNNNRKPIRSVKKPGTINNIAAKAIDAPETIS